jgi:hypothetical protein
VITIDDFVMLGKTVPEEDSQGRITVCSAGYSQQLGALLRLYPLARFDSPTRWSTSVVHLERNPKDNRPESWKLYGDRTTGAHDQINRAAFTVGTPMPMHARGEALKPFVVGSLAEANERRDWRDRHISLAVLQPSAMAVEFDHNPESPESPELKLFDLPGDEPSGAKRFPYIPRLRFQDERAESAPLLRDWGVYERMRKAPDFATWTDSERRADITAALHLDESCSLLIGNFNRHRNRWLVISVLRNLKAEPTLFDDLGA